MKNKFYELIGRAVTFLRSIYSNRNSINKVSYICSRQLLYDNLIEGRWENGRISFRNNENSFKEK